MAVSMARNWASRPWRCRPMQCRRGDGSLLRPRRDEAYVFCPDDTPDVNVREIAMQGAEVFLVDGLIDDCGRLVAEGEKALGWFNCSTLREPYRIEGKKTMGLELAEQLGWEVPDVIFYPTGGGTGLIGMWKAFDELEQMGWIGKKRPRMVAVQARLRADGQGLGGRCRACAALAGCAYFRRRHSVPQAVGDFLILRRSGERRLRHRVDDTSIADAWREVARDEGYCFVRRARRRLPPIAGARRQPGGGKRSSGSIQLREWVKYPMPEAGTRLKLGNAVDWQRLVGSAAGS